MLPKYSTLVKCFATAAAMRYNEKKIQANSEVCRNERRFYMSLRYFGELVPYAKKLRKEATPQERHLWYDFLSSYPIRFQRQKTVGRYIVDFYCHRARLAIELDGSQHYQEHGLISDAERTAFLNRRGLLWYCGFPMRILTAGLLQHVNRLTAL